MRKQKSYIPGLLPLALLLLPLDIISKLKCDDHTCVYSCVSGVVVNVSPFQHNPTSVTEKVVWRFHSPIGQQCLKSRISRLKRAAETSSSSFSILTDCSPRSAPSRPGRKRRRIGTAKPAKQTPKSWADPTPIAVRHRDERVEGSQFENSFFLYLSVSPRSFHTINHDHFASEGPTPTRTEAGAREATRTWKDSAR